MPAKSKAQQRFMAMVEHNPNASPAVAQAAGSMSKSQARDFAATKTSKLPEHVKHKPKHHGRGSDNEMGRRRNPRGGNPY